MAIDLNFQQHAGRADPERRGRRRLPERQRLPELPLITSAAPEGGGTRVIGTLNSLASTTFDLDFYANPSAARGRARSCRPSIHRLDPGHDGRLRQRRRSTRCSDADRGRLAGHRHGDRRPTETRRSSGRRSSSRRAGASAGRATTTRSLSSGQLFERRRHADDRRQLRAATLSTATTRIDFVGPALIAGRRLRRHRDEPGRTLGHAPQRIRLALLGRPVQRPFRPAHLQARRRRHHRRHAAEATTAPTNNVTRQQMAVFVLKSKHGVCYTPPPCTGDLRRRSVQLDLRALDRAVRRRGHHAAAAAAGTSARPARSGGTRWPSSS